MTSYSEELGAKVCAAYAAGTSLTSLCLEPGMPTRGTVRRWARERPAFAAMFAEAGQARARLFEADPELARAAGGHAGRPCGYTEEMAERICARIAAGDSIADLQACPAFPAQSTIYRWMRIEPAFGKMYAAACAQRGDLLAEEVLDIADDDSGDFYEDEDGRWTPNRLAIWRAREKIAARKWLVAQLRPRKDWGAPEEAPMTWEQILDELD